MTPAPTYTYEHVFKYWLIHYSIFNEFNVRSYRTGLSIRHGNFIHLKEAILRHFDGARLPPIALRPSAISIVSHDGGAVGAPPAARVEAGGARDDGGLA